jgi:acetoin utilization protein AcuB
MTQSYDRQSQRPVSELMTPVPHSVTADQTISQARERMRALGVRHLPVTQEGEVVGVLSERELNVLNDWPGFDADTRTVGDVVSGAPCLVEPDASFHSALASMSKGKADCCVVIDEGRTVGILTSSDLMLLLSSMLTGRPGPREHGLRPSEVRERILAEHTVIRSLLTKVDDLARDVIDGDLESDGPLREHARELYQTLLRHIELENMILAPALRESDSFGPEREHRLRSEHEQQRARLAGSLATLDDNVATAVARDVRALIADLREDMMYEERALLNDDLLKDDVIAVDASGS